MLRRFGSVMLFGSLACSFGANANPDSKKMKKHVVVEDSQITLEELKAAVDQKSATIIDANGEKVYNEGHIPGAISFAKHSEDLAKLLPKEKNALVIAYCGGPMCTAWEFPANKAKKLGYTNVKHYKGGIKGWKEAKYPVETSSNKS